MKKTIANKNGFTLVEVTEFDEQGNVLRIKYEVYGPDGELLESFATLEDAEEYFESVTNERPTPSP